MRENEVKKMHDLEEVREAELYIGIMTCIIPTVRVGIIHVIIIATYTVWTIKIKYIGTLYCIEKLR